MGLCLFLYRLWCLKPGDLQLKFFCIFDTYMCSALFGYWVFSKV